MPSKPITANSHSEEVDYVQISSESPVDSPNNKPKGKYGYFKHILIFLDKNVRVIAFAFLIVLLVALVVILVTLSNKSAKDVAPPIDDWDKSETDDVDGALTSKSLKKKGRISKSKNFLVDSSIDADLTNKNGLLPSNKTVILVSLGGFKYAYLKRNITPNLNLIVEHGVAGTEMTPQFPPSSSPNLYTIVTGVRPIRHGIINNEMFDSQVEKSFDLFSTSEYPSPCLVQPIWNSLQDHGFRAAVNNWPGCQMSIEGKKPSYYNAYDPTTNSKSRIMNMLNWLNLPYSEIPSFLATYLDVAAIVGSQSGTAGDLIAKAIKEIDDAIGIVWSMLSERQLLGKVNLIITSDYGMSDIQSEQIVALADIIPMEKVLRVFYGPVTFLWPKYQDDVPLLYKKLSLYSDHHGGYDVYLKKDLPLKFELTNSTRISPIVLISQTGCMVLETVPTVTTKGGSFGYPPSDSSMNGLFIAVGPNIRNETKPYPFISWSRKITLDLFSNIEVYPLLMKLFNISSSNDDKSDYLVSTIFKSS